MFETILIIVCFLIGWGIWELGEFIIKSMRF